MSIYHSLGVMSGTSLDGLDLALCRFEKTEEKWNYAILDAKTFPYEEDWQEKLTNSVRSDAMSLIDLHNKYGEYIGSCINKFLDKKTIPVDLIASHGHTLFHQPENKLTFQLGNGASIAATTGITTVSDFRTLDVAHGGQGAPLVPVGDRLLFGEYEYCLNLGGFANISYEKENHRIAYDISPVNIVINHYASKTGIPYDVDGLLARTGTTNLSLLDKLNNLDYYKQSPPKSLGREWVENIFFPIINNYSLSVNDILHTIYDHIASQISKQFQNTNKEKLLITGGGAFNKYLIELITSKITNQIIIPDDKTISFKEALIFAFLGILRYMNKINCYKSVTGSQTDTVSGVIYLIE